MLGIRPQRVIDMVVKGSVVLMVGGGLENRIKVDRCNPEVLQVVQSINDALQIAPISAPDEVEPDILSICFFVGLQLIPIRGPGVDLPGGSQIMRQSAFEISQRRVGIWIAVAKAFREYLIPYGMLCPMRRPVGSVAIHFEDLLVLKRARVAE